MNPSACDCRVVVVGGGIIGLTSALALLEHGYRNVTLVAKSFEDTTSHVAGGLWMPFELPAHLDPTTPRSVTSQLSLGRCQRADLAGSFFANSKWCEVSYEWLKDMWHKHGDATGIHVVPAIDVSAEGLPPVVRSQPQQRVVSFIVQLMLGCLCRRIRTGHTASTTTAC